MKDKENKRQRFLEELHALLKTYGAGINATNHWQGYPECGQDIRMEVEFNDYRIEDIDLGDFIDGKKHGGKANS